MGAQAHSRADTDRLLTLEEFERLPEEDGYQLELVRGRIVREPAPAPAPRRGMLSIELAAPLHTFVREHGLGAVLIHVGFVLAEDPPTVRAPDLAFIALHRIPPQGYDAGFWHIAPDLAVEILSPSNTRSAVRFRTRPSQLRTARSPPPNHPTPTKQCLTTTYIPATTRPADCQRIVSSSPVHRHGPHHKPRRPTSNV